MLDKLASLRELDLSHNNIATLREVQMSNLPNIKMLNLSHNRLKFKDLDDYSLFVEKINKLSSLTDLQLQENPWLNQEFIDPELDRVVDLEYELLKTLRRLEIYNQLDFMKYFIELDN